MPKSVGDLKATGGRNSFFFLMRLTCFNPPVLQIYMLTMVSSPNIYLGGWFDWIESKIEWLINNG